MDGDGDDDGDDDGDGNGDGNSDDGDDQEPACCLRRAVGNVCAEESGGGEEVAAVLTSILHSDTIENFCTSTSEEGHLVIWVMIL